MKIRVVVWVFAFAAAGCIFASRTSISLMVTGAVVGALGGLAMGVMLVRYPACQREYEAAVQRLIPANCMDCS